MGMIGQAELGRLFNLNKELWNAVSSDSRAAQPMKLMIYLHLTKPWIPGYLSLAISPLKDGLSGYLQAPVFSWNGMTFYFPSARWWQAHSDSHSPAGAGCDVDRHDAFLTRGGSDAEFVYAAVLKNGDIRILERPDFEEECAFWASGSRGR